MLRIALTYTLSGLWAVAGAFPSASIALYLGENSPSIKTWFRCLLVLKALSDFCLPWTVWRCLTVICLHICLLSGLEAPRRLDRSAVLWMLGLYLKDEFNQMALDQRAHIFTVQLLQQLNLTQPMKMPSERMLAQVFIRQLGGQRA